MKLNRFFSQKKHYNVQVFDKLKKKE